ncbi:MAG: hypothetical protein DMG11_09620 [Acidobacteria bacterium]|nr:MAG: hypothetical protein DMG11_09620 [Acidobacteriota bacterium]
MLPVPGRKVPRDLSAGGRCSGFGHRNPILGSHGRENRFRPVRSGTGHGADRAWPQRDHRSGIGQSRGSAFQGFVRDQYTTLPDLLDRPLHMWLDLDWLYDEPSNALNSGSVSTAIRRMVHDTFSGFESGSIQQVIYQIGTKILAEIPVIAEVHLEANNRTWDTVIERGQETGVYTDARPPYGCLGLRLRR